MRIAIGQYVPGTSALHRADPRTKFVLTFAYMVVVMIADNYAAYLAAALYLGAAYVCARINVGKILRSLRPLIIMMVLTALLNLFFYRGTTVWIEVWKITIYKESALFALRMVLRIILLVLGSSVLTYTTTSVMLTDGLESLFSPLKKIRFPVHEIAMMMSIALRFIPTLIEEADKITKAQLARGADFESGNVFKRAKSMLPILIPLFVNSFRRADELAMAMESRCYHGGEGRTRMRVLKFHMGDLAAVIIFAAFILSLIHI